MTEEDARAYFIQLAAILERHKLEWVLAEVNNTIRLGKLRSKKVQVEEDLWGEGEERNVLETASRRKSPQRFTVSEPYGPKEQLLILVTAIATISVDMEAVERRTAKLIERSARKAQSATFATDAVVLLHDENIDKTVWESSREIRDRLHALAAKISPLIDALRRELDAH